MTEQPHAAEHPRGRRRATPVGVVAIVAVALAVSILLVELAGRGGGPVAALEADAVAGRGLLLEHGCAACHDIPGLRHPTTHVGPSLAGLADRAYLAGQLPNTPDHLVAWIVDPQALVPGTAMPTLGVSEGEARDMAAYLATLGGGRS